MKLPFFFLADKFILKYKSVPFIFNEFIGTFGLSRAFADVTDRKIPADGEDIGLQRRFEIVSSFMNKKLNENILRQLLRNGKIINVTVDEADEEGVIVYHLHVAEGDMGRVIGKQGRIAKAIRTVMRAAASRKDQKVAVEID